MYITSESGLNLIKKWEGFRSSWYRCPAGLKTIGYGHVALKGDDFPHVTEEEATELLKKDIAEREKQLNSLELDIVQNEFDALMSFIYNIGYGAFLGSTVCKALKNNDRDTATRWWAKWIGKPPLPGLINRRKEEIELFNNGEI